VLRARSGTITPSRGQDRQEEEWSGVAVRRRRARVCTRACCARALDRDARPQAIVNRQE
jgi:hypothetical protein